MKKIWTVQALIRYNFNAHGPVCMLVYTTLELPLTATSLQRALKRVPNCQNNLSTTVMEWPRKLIRTARRWLVAASLSYYFCGKELTREKVAFREEMRLEGNENGQTLRLPYPFKDILIFIVFNLYLAVTINCLRCEPWVVLSCQQFVSRHYLIQIGLFMIGLPLGNSKHELRTKNICHITPLPSHNYHVSSTVTFFCPHKVAFG